MRSYSAPVIAQLVAGQAGAGVAFLMETENSPTDGAVWNGAGNLTLDGVVYVGLQTNGIAVTITHELGVGANGITVRFSSNDSWIISQVLGQDLRGRWLTIKDLTFNVQGTVLTHDEDVFFGNVDRVQTSDIPGDGTEPGVAVVEIHAVGEAQGLERGLGRLAANQDQAHVDPADTGFRMTATAGSIVLTWGGSAPLRAAVALPNNNSNA